MFYIGKNIAVSSQGQTVHEQITHAAAAAPRPPIDPITANRDLFGRPRPSHLRRWRSRRSRPSSARRRSRGGPLRRARPPWPRRGGQWACPSPRTRQRRLRRHPALTYPGIVCESAVVFGNKDKFCNCEGRGSAAALSGSISKLVCRTHRTNSMLAGVVKKQQEPNDLAQGHGIVGWAIVGAYTWYRCSRFDTV